MNIKKVLKVFIFGLILLCVGNSCFANEPNDYSYHGIINFTGSIFKTNDRHEGLTGAKFRIYDVNNTFSYNLQEEGDGLYGLAYFIEDIDDNDDDYVQHNYRLDNKDKVYNIIHSMMPRELQEDYNEYLRNGNVSHLNTSFYRIQGNTIVFMVPLFLEEITAPQGYKKAEKIVIPAYVSITKNSNNISTRLDVSSPDMYAKYNENVDYDNPINYYVTGSYLNDVVDCTLINIDRSIFNNKNINYMPLILFNEKSDVLLRINNYVNSLEQYTTSRGKILNYLIEIENYGTSASHNNVIVTNVPKELEYVSGSASDGGIYNKTNHTITWKVSIINAKDKKSYRYSAKVPKNVSLGAKFIGKTSITSEEIGEIHSRETTVSLLSNPETIVPIAVLILLCSLIGVIVVIKNHYNEKQKELES